MCKLRSILEVDFLNKLFLFKVRSILEVEFVSEKSRSINEVRKKSVLNQHKAICCDNCNQWVHIKCNNLNDLDYKLLKSKNENWYCILCTPEILLFCQINEKMFIPKGNLNKPTDALVNLMNQLNNFTEDEKENELNVPNCKYRDTNYFKNLTKDFKRKDLSFFHMNVCSLTNNSDDFNVLLSELNFSFDILAITETRIKKD